MATADQLMATICADCPKVWQWSCACNGWCVRTGERLPDPPVEIHCPVCGMNQDPCICDCGDASATKGDEEGGAGQISGQMGSAPDHRPLLFAPP